MRPVFLLLAVLASTLVACDSGGDPDPLPVDTTPPVVQITAPAAGSQLSGYFRVRYTATDPGVLPRLDILVDGQPAVIYLGDVDSARYPNGPHTLVVRVTDDAGNVGTSPVVTVTFAN